MNILGFFQRLGRSLQLPIAVLPVAALMLRFGQPDLLNLAFMAQAGGAIFDNLALIFAIGVASTWSKDNAGSAALAGAVGYFILVKGASVFGDNVTINYIISGNVNDIKTIVLDSSFISKAEELKVGVSSAFGSNGVDIANSIVQSINVAKVNMGVLAGIITGLVGGMSYNRWNDIKLPDFLSFFGGKRFVPIVTGFICLIIAGLLGYVWPPVQVAIRDGGEWIVEQGALGSGIFGFVNRLLIPTGLHQVLNTIAWFQIGDYTDAAGKIFHGDINRFYNGDATAGMFMSGFFPIMMFGLPGAAFAMYFAAKPDRRASVGGLLLSVALTAFLTGVTEPLEFMFMFLAPLLYLVHAVLTGISLYIATALGIHAGFTFSAGAIDYALMYKLPAASNNVWILLVMGLVAFVVYFLLFTVIIRAFNLKTPGREDDSGEALPEANSHTDEGLDALAISYINAIGGSDNLTGIDACITRLRLTVKDSGIVDSNAAKRLGAAGVVKLNKQSIQIIVGAKAESIADSMRKVIASGEAPKVVATALTTAAAVEKETPQVSLIKPVDTDKAFKLSSLVSPMTGDIVDLASVPDEAFASKAVGDGIAIRPTDNLVVSPANGTLVKIFGTNHAFCLETEDGAEVVVHIGIDTVKLNGQGFKRLAEEGATVKTGDPVLELDLEYLTLNAASIISPVVVSNVDDFSGVFDIATGSVIAGQTKLFDIKE